ncbi:pitrilysin family protein [uncultured Vibrio sp.]|uniref:M16 family metallopeptidase n=1 Tax=uncultured Vibrio sp. TaxID=114054 RepID=UPI0025D1E10B|nr:M16 family metallopeptidase [uncultured Vibrio sp.]
MKYFFRILTLSLVSTFLLACASSPPPVALKSNPLWSSHTLDNGFTYHLRHSDKTPVSMRLVVHSGSLQETEQQLGYAHFLEHMAFNGTKHFKGNEIIALFEQAGASFGADVNAYTSYHETVYKLDLPSRDKIDEGLLWFGDISQHIDLNEGEIEKEKGVVIGEIRRSRPENKPLAYKYYDHLIEGTQYQARDPIGTKNTIENLSVEQLKSYYQQWYQPARTELVIYGNFDQTDVEKLIHEQFSHWENTTENEGAEPAEKGQSYNLTDLIVTIQEAETPSYAMVFDRGDRATLSLQTQQQAWLDEIAHTTIKHRLSTRFKDSALPVIGMYSIDYNLPHQRLFLTEIAFPADKREQNQALFQTTMAELRDHGISQDELAIIRGEWQTRLENLDTNWNNIDALGHVDGKVNALVLNQPDQDREQYRQNLTALKDNLSVKTLNRHLNKLLSSPYQLVIGVDQQENSEQVVANVSKWRNNTDRPASKPLSLAVANTAFSAPSTPGTVISQEALGQGQNIHTWSLSNGIDVWYQQDPTVGSKVHMVLASRGGKAVLDDDLIVASDIAINAVSRSGIGDFNGSSLEAHLRRHDLTFLPFINFTHHGVELQSNQKNLTDSFAALHTVFTDINIDASQLEAVKQEFHQAASTYISSPFGQFNKALNHVSYLPTSRHYFREIEEIDAINTEKIERIHTELFTKNRNYQLVIIGDLEASELTPLLRQYIASIPLETVPDRQFDVAYKDYQNERVDMSVNNEQSSAYLLRLTNPHTKPSDAKAVFIDDMVRRMLTQRLTAYVREELSLDYAPSAFSANQDSELASDWMLVADTDPNDVEKVELAIDEVIKGILSSVSQKEVESTGSQLANDMIPLNENAAERAWFYTRYLIHNYEIDSLFDPKQQVEKISLDDVQNRVNLLFGSDSMVVKGIMRPKEKS